MNQMFLGLWNVDEHTRDKLKWVDRLFVVDIVSGFWLINKEPRFRMITKSRQIHWRALQVASEAPAFAEASARPRWSPSVSLG